MSDIQEEQKRLYKRAEENDIKLLKEENKKLKELCDKYEEEHNNEFQCWKRDRKELLDKRNRINKAIEYINVIKNNTPSSNRKDNAKMILINYELLLDIFLILLFY